MVWVVSVEVILLVWLFSIMVSCVCVSISMISMVSSI